MLAYKVSGLLKDGVGATRHYPISGELRDIDENNTEATPVEGEVTLLRIPRGILAKGTAHLELKEPCRRCLELASSEVDLEFEEEFIPSIDIETGASLPVTEADEPDLLIDEQHVLDLTEVLRQYAVMAGNSSALCRPDCKGLCPICGINRNEETCDCDRQAIDPRLASLARLLESQDDDE